MSVFHTDEFAFDRFLDSMDIIKMEPDSLGQLEELLTVDKLQEAAISSWEGVQDRVASQLGSI